MDALHRKPLLYLILLGLRWQSFRKNSLITSSSTLASADQTFSSPLPREEKETTVQSSTPPPPPPNIIILFADNLAYEDISFFQRHQHSTTPTAAQAPKHKQQQHKSQPKTPHVDSIGNAGMSFSHWNSAAHLCSASRAALLTGQYPVRTGIYPGVFRPDSVHGLASNDTRITTLASQLKKQHYAGGGGGYATSIVGKWHLGHARPEYLPTSHGFDEWLGIPYHMSGGSVDNHTCVFDEEQQEMWLPLYQNGSTIVEQPVRLEHLAKRYAHAATDFIHRSVTKTKPFFLYMAFSHVHQLCAPAHWSEQDTCQWTAATPTSASFADAVQEMDWVVGQILKSLADEDIVNNTMVWFTSDNGPWVAEQDCSGSKGPFQGQWLREHAPLNCTSCPQSYVPRPTPSRPRRCVLSKPKRQQQGQMSVPLLQEEEDDDEEEEGWTLDGIHCGEDVGLGSLWEANLRMPAMVQWPGQIPAKSTSDDLVSTLDIMPTVLAVVQENNRIQQAFSQRTDSACIQGQKLIQDGMDLSPILFDYTSNAKVNVDEVKDARQDFDNRVLFFWRDGFEQGPLDPPYGRMDVAAVKVGPRLKAWLWTKSAHYNNDTEVHHDPPLIFDVINDPAEAHPLDPEQYTEFIAKVKRLVRQHKVDMEPWGQPLTLERDSAAIPCVDRAAHCRTHDPPENTIPGVTVAFLESILAGSDKETASDTR